MNSKGQIGIGGVAVAALIFLFVLTILGQFLAIFSQTFVNANTGQATLVSGFTNGVINLVNLIPIVLVGGLLIGIIVIALRLRG